jgi:hypothetical protein
MKNNPLLNQIKAKIQSFELRGLNPQVIETNKSITVIVNHGENFATIELVFATGKRGGARIRTKGFYNGKATKADLVVARIIHDKKSVE